MVINITGYNLGKCRDDILSITIKDISCSTIIHVSTQQVLCLTTAFRNSESITSADVTLNTIAGSMQGIYLQPKVLLAANTMRPIISDITFNIPPFIPNTCSLSPTMNIYTLLDPAGVYLGENLSPPSLTNPISDIPLEVTNDNNNYDNNNKVNWLNGHIYLSLLGI